MRSKLMVRINFAGASASAEKGPVWNEAVRASLEAVRASRRAARRRIWRARGVALGVVGLGALGVLGIGRLSRLAVGGPAPALGPRPDVATAAPVVSAPPPSVSASPVAGVPAEPSRAPSAPPSGPVADAPGLLSVAPQPVRLAASARTAPTADAPERAAASPEAQACAEAFARHRWNTVVSSCATAYEQHPDAEIALWLAQAHHRQARVATAGVWAERSIALDDQRPEAFILLARAAVLAGQSEEAARAYRAYLALAPRGWHAREARAAAGWRPLP